MSGVALAGLAVFLVVFAIMSHYDFKRQRSHAQLQAELLRTTQQTLLTALRLLALHEPKDVDYPRMIQRLERELAERELAER